MKILLHLVPAVCIALFSSAASALVTVDLYSAEVPVPEAARAVDQSAAAADALARVLVKISGRSATLELPAIRRALEEPGDYLTQYTYVQSDAPEGRRARFDFDPRAVADLVREAGAPFWTSSRPSVLVWLILRDAGDSVFVTPETRPELAGALRDAFAQRGLPVRFPLLDLQDTARLPLLSAWRLSVPALLGASARYDAHHVAAARAAVAPTGRWLGDWLHLSDAGWSRGGGDAPGPGAFFQSLAALSAETMAARYAVDPRTPSRGGGALRVAVENVSDFNAYAAVMQWLQALELVQQAQVVEVAGATLVLELAVLGSREQVARIIELNESFQPLEAMAPQLRYRWRQP